MSIGKDPSSKSYLVAESPTSKEQILPPALPAGLAHLASLWAPVIRETGGARGGDADRPLQRPPLVQVALGARLPQFPVPLHLEVELSRSLSVDISDTDETRRFVDGSDTDETRKIVDASDHEPTLKRPLVEKKRALELVADESDAEATRRRPMSSAPPPVTLEATSELSDLDLEEVPADDALVSGALRRQMRVRRAASRLVAAMLAIGALVLVFAVVRVGRAEATRGEAGSVIEFSVAKLSIDPRVEPSIDPGTDAAGSPGEQPREVATGVAPIELDAATRAPVIAPPRVVQVATSKPQATGNPVITSTSKSISKVMPKAPLVTATTGFLDTGSEAKGHRVFVDGFVAGFAPSSIKLKCGAHSVRVGSAGKMQRVVVPCGGRVSVLSLAPPEARPLTKHPTKLPAKPPAKLPAKPAAKKN